MSLASSPLVSAMTRCDPLGEADRQAMASGLRLLALGLTLSLVPGIGQAMGLGPWLTVAGLRRWPGGQWPPNTPSDAAPRDDPTHGSLTAGVCVEGMVLVAMSLLVLVCQTLALKGILHSLLCLTAFSELMTWRRCWLLKTWLTPWAKGVGSASAEKDLCVGPWMVVAGGHVIGGGIALYVAGGYPIDREIPPWFLIFGLVGMSLRLGGLTVIALGVWQVVAGLGRPTPDTNSSVTGGEPV